MPQLLEPPGEKEKLWSKVMEVGPDFEKGDVHKMPEPVIVSLIRSIPDDPAHNNSSFQIQLGWDITHYNYKLYDEIGMLLTDRTKGHEGQTPELEKKTEAWAVDLAKDFIGCSTIAKDQQELYQCIGERSSIGKEIKENGNSKSKFNFSAKEVLRGILDG